MTSMDGLDRLLSLAESMSRSPVRNYVVPGLTSSLVGGPSHGMVRLFSSDRATREWVTPHSHRFDFVCIVLAGRVENIKFTPCESDSGDAYAIGAARPRLVGMGQYEFTRGKEATRFGELPLLYEAGDLYAMRHDEIHSIRFSRDARVLFFEGPPVVRDSLFLEPFSDGRPIPTFTVHPWMFEREASDGD